MNEIYETDRLLSEYLLFHYGKDEEILDPAESWPQGLRDALGFPVRTVSWFSQDTVARGLDLGCAVGRSTFEMARRCANVTGIDFSHRFIEAAETLRSGNTLPYHRLDEGHAMTCLKAGAPEGIDSSGIRFAQGDAMNLEPDLARFDRVHAANLICRLADPSRLLARLPDLVAPDGELILATPCTWLAEFTRPDHWPTGSTLEWLKDSLSPFFRLAATGEEPFLIRETSRKFQWTRSQVSLWQRNS